MSALYNMAHPYQLGLGGRLWLNILQVFAGMLFYLVHIVSQLCRYRVCVIVNAASSISGI